MTEFEIVERAIGPVVEIEETVPVWRMPSVFGRDYKRIAGYIQAQGAKISGMAYAHYLDMDWERELGRGKLSTLLSMPFKRWHFFAGMPSSSHLERSGDLLTKVIENTRYARAVYRGPYREVSETYKALSDWVKQQQLSMQNEVYEFYLNDPREVGLENTETEILVPLRG